MRAYLLIPFLLIDCGVGDVAVGRDQDQAASDVNAGCIGKVRCCASGVFQCVPLGSTCPSPDNLCSAPGPKATLSPISRTPCSTTFSASKASLAVDTAGNILVAGELHTANTTSRSFFVTKYDPSCKVLWAQGFPTTQTFFSTSSTDRPQVAVDATGNAFVFGNFERTLTVGTTVLQSLRAPGSNQDLLDLFLLKLSPTGQLLWVKQFGDASVDESRGVAVDASGDVVVTGSFFGKLDFGGGGAPLSAVNPIYGGDIYIAKFDGNGTPLWSRSFGERDNDIGQSVAIDGSGNIVLVADTERGLDFGGGVVGGSLGMNTAVVKLSPAGVHLWSKALGGGGALGQQRSSGLDPAGNVWVAGDLWSPLDLGAGALGVKGDAFIAELDPNGKALASRVFHNQDPPFQGMDSAPQDLGAVAIASDPDGNPFVAGWTAGHVDFGDGTVDSTGGMSSTWRSSFGLRLDGSGKTVTKRLLPTASVMTLAVDGAASVVLAGHFAGKLDLPGGGAPVLVEATTGVDTMFLAKLPSL